MTRRPGGPSGPDSAARLDLAIDALIDARPALLSVDVPEDLELLELLATARVLHDALPRFHPRFGFEDRLARQLRGGGTTVVSRPVAVLGPVETARRGSLRRRGLVAGGAIASGLSLALPLAGAALVAWRRSRPTGGIG